MLKEDQYAKWGCDGVEAVLKTDSTQFCKARQFASLANHLNVECEEDQMEINCAAWSSLVVLWMV